MLLRLEHGKLAYFADFATYGLAVVGMAALLIAAGPGQQWWSLGLLTGAGLLGWTLIEYVLHRFVLHGLQPFQGWHAAHHDRPTALICTPTVLSAGLIAVLVTLPALLLGRWPACALTLGILVGYLAYTVTHHLTHHWRARTAWLERRKRWHAAHHRTQHKQRPVCFGVTTDFWDRVFGSAHANVDTQGQKLG